MFTRDQIEEIRMKLQLTGRKDTSFPEAGSLKGEETVAIVQNGENRRLSVRDLIHTLGVFTLSDFVNVSKSDEDSYTLGDAVALVPIASRKAGQVITFMDSATGDWSIYQFKGKSAVYWSDLDLWDNILEKVDNHFKGWFFNTDLLKKFCPTPKPGDYVFIGDTLDDAIVYSCIRYGEWYNTKYPASTYADKFLAVYSEDFDNTVPKLDETYADRATKDSLGRTIHDTYLTRDGLTDLITHIVRDEITRQISELR